MISGEQTTLICRCVYCPLLNYGCRGASPILALSSFISLISLSNLLPPSSRSLSRDRDRCLLRSLWCLRLSSLWSLLCLWPTKTCRLLVNEYLSFQLIQIIKHCNFNNNNRIWLNLLWPKIFIATVKIHFNLWLL